MDENFKFAINKSSLEMKFAELVISENGRSLSEIQKENNCYYYALTLSQEKHGFETNKIGVSKMPDSFGADKWLLKQVGCREMNDWFKKNNKPCSFKKIEKKFLEAISCYKTRALFK